MLVQFNNIEYPRRLKEMFKQKSNCFKPPWNLIIGNSNQNLNTYDMYQYIFEIILLF